MKKVDQCLILAAGNGTRIRSVSAGLPKPLVDFRGTPILEHVIRRASQAGIEKFVIVVGYRSDLIRNWFDGRSLGVSVSFVENSEYHKSNGISALQAKDKIHENFLLLMADHIFEPETAQALLEQRLQPGEVILAVDPNIDRIFDLDDATKARSGHKGWRLFALRWNAAAGQPAPPACHGNRRGSMARRGYPSGTGVRRRSIRWVHPPRTACRESCPCLARRQKGACLSACLWGCLAFFCSP